VKSARPADFAARNDVRRPMQARRESAESCSHYPVASRVGRGAQGSVATLTLDAAGRLGPRVLGHLTKFPRALDWLRPRVDLGCLSDVSRKRLLRGASLRVVSAADGSALDDRFVELSARSLSFKCDADQQPFAGWSAGQFLSLVCPRS